MKNEVAVFFDGIAENWDKTNNCSSEIIDKILDAAEVGENDTVLDVGSGTGVLIPYLTARKAKITVIDVSEEMLKISKKKYGEGIEYICADISGYKSDRQYSRVIVHNAFPHFLDRNRAVNSLKALTESGGTLTIAHSISRAAVLRCHKNVPQISLELPEAEYLGDMIKDGFRDIKICENDNMYLVTGIKI